jgi:hypothetical protein
MGDLVRYLNSKLNRALEALNQLITYYECEDNPDRNHIIQQSGAIFDLVISYMKIEDNQIYPRFRRDGNLDREYHESRNLQREIEAIMDSSVLMHVDEPSNDFLDNLYALRRVLEHLRRLDQKLVFPQIQEGMTPEMEAEIDAHLQEEMLHEGGANRILNAPY